MLGYVFGCFENCLVIGEFADDLIIT